MNSDQDKRPDASARNWLEARKDLRENGAGSGEARPGPARPMPPGGGRSPAWSLPGPGLGPGPASSVAGLQGGTHGAASAPSPVGKGREDGRVLEECLEPCNCALGSERCSWLCRGSCLGVPVPPGVSACCRVTGSPPHPTGVLGSASVGYRG